MLDALQHYLTFPFQRLLAWSDPFNVYFLAGALLCAAGWYGVHRGRRPWGRMRAFLRAVRRPAIFRHRSSQLDIGLFFATSLLFASGITSGLVAGDVVQFLTLRGLELAFGPAAADARSLAADAVATVATVLALELGYWVAHWLMHRNPVLWEFHKVHHSAEVLTPLTEWRQHPVELFLFPGCIAMMLGIESGLVAYVFGSSTGQFTVLGTNVVLVLLMGSFLHLRHTQLWLPARGWLGRLVQSPAHHQIHHSADPRHFDKNLGLCLSVWDWAFGTLYVPEQRERLHFGLGAESREHRGVIAAYWRPVVKAGRVLGRRRASAQLPAHQARQSLR